MYLVNKATGKIHAYFKQNPRLMAVQDGQTPSYLSGNVYFDPDRSLTLERLRELNFTEDYDEIDYDDDNFAMHSIEQPFVFLCNVHYASYKNYRIIHFADGIQVGGDFSNDDLIEVQAFVALLFRKSVGDEEIRKWNDGDWDKYGLLARVADEFTITGDDDDLIYDTAYLTDRPQLESPMHERFREQRLRDAEERSRLAAC